MITKIYQLFRAGLVYCCAAAALVACSPETFESPSQSGIPSIQNVDINIDLDQSVNQATFTVANMPKQAYPIWLINGTQYSTLNPAVWSNSKAGTYSVELRLGNYNGFSQGSVSKSFTFDKSQVDFTAYYNRISRTWRINYSESGHMGCGEPGTDGSNWWSAAPGDKADWGVYDDRISFTGGGSYTYNPGEGGTMYVNTGCSIFSEYNTNDGQDFMVPVEEQTNGFMFDSEGDKIILKLDPNSYFPYISSDAQFANPVFTVSKLTNNEMVLLYEGDGITWRFVFTSKEEGDEPTPEAKVDWDYNAASNLWKAVDEGAALVGMGYYFADDSWSPIDYTEATHNGDTYEITMPAGLGGSQWQGQFHIDTNLKASASKKYNFYMVMEADNDCPGVTFKLTDAGDTNYFVEERIPVPAGQFVFKREGVSLKEGADADAIRLFFDFGGTPGGTKVKISKIYFEEAVAMDYDDVDNLWKAVDDGSALDGMGYYFADNNWSPIDYTEATHSGNTYELTLPEGLGGSQWQGQFHIDTDLTAKANKEYHFQVVVTADADCPGVTIKLTDSGDSNFFCEGRHDIKADEPYTFTLKNATLKDGADASAIRLFFDFGGSTPGTKVKISKIVFKEA